jgi:hypothetical protein
MTVTHPREDAMQRSTWARPGRGLAIAGLMVLLAGTAAVAGTTPASATVSAAETARAAWLLQRDASQTHALTGEFVAADDFGGSAASGATDFKSGKQGGALPVLASLVLPGAGEAMLGHKRGFVMMALDIFAWTRVAKYHGDGNDLRDEYYAFADAHYRDGLLAQAYIDGSADIERGGMGAIYFPTYPSISDSSESELERVLPLYVTKEEDRREYYENLGKWDQFVFGWDDFMSPQSYAGLPGNEDYTPTGNAKIDLEQPWVSENREAYRLMRDASNDAFKTRDRWLYVNIGLRIFSVLQTAYFDGLLGGNGDGNGDDRVSLAGHEIKIIAQPTGLKRAVVAASVSF